MLANLISRQSLMAGIIFFLYKAGESMLDATIRPFIIQAVCRRDNPDNASLCSDLSVQSEIEQENTQQRASIYLIYYRTLINVPAIMLGLLWGAWSDRHSRKLPMMIPSLGSVFAVLFYLASLRSNEWTITFILCGSFVQGVFGKSPVITMAVNSYLSDITEQQHRTNSLSNLLAMNYFGLFIGSLLSGTIQQYTNIQTTLIVVCFLHAFSVIGTACCIKEYENEDSGNNKSTRVVSLTGLKDNILAHLKSSKTGNTRVFVILILITVFNQMCKVGDQDVTVMFVKKSPLEWPTSWYSYLLAVEYSAMGASLLIFTPLLTNYFKIRDTTIIIIGVWCKIIRSLWAGLCYQTWMVFTSVIIGAFGCMLVSAARSLLSKNVNEADLGKAFAILACAETSSKVVGAILFNYVYGATVAVFSGSAYILEMFCYMVVLVFAIWLQKDLDVSSAYNLIKGNLDKTETIDN